MGSSTKAELIAEVAALRKEAEVLAARQRELTALLQAQQTIVSSLDLEQILQAIVEQAAAISGCASIRLFLPDEASQVLRCRVGFGLLAAELEALEVPIAESLSGRVAATGESLAVADIRGDSRVWHPELATQHGIISYLGLPVKLASRLFGVLAFSTPVPRIYSEGEIALLAGFAERAALALENARLFHQEQRRRRQLEAVRTVCTEITRELDLPTLLRLITQRAMELTGAAGGDVFLWDETLQLLTPQAAHGLSARRQKTTRRLGEGVTGMVAQRRQGMLVNDYRSSPWASPHTLAHTAIAVVVSEPLLYRDRLLGVIGVDREEGSQPFTEQDRETLALFAAHAAIAIENSRLYTEARRQRGQLEAVQSLTAEITQELDLNSLLALITKRVVDLFGGSSGAVHFWDEANQVLTPRAWHGNLQPWQKDVRYKLGEGIVGAVAVQRRGLVVNDYRHSAYAHPLFVERTHITAVLAEPLLYQERLLGAIAITLDEPGRVFTQEDRELLALFASQIAIAIENARLHTATVRRGAELEALLRATRSVMSGLDLQGILDRIVAEAQQMAGAPHVKVLLLDHPAGVLRVGAARGTASTPGETFPLDHGVSAIVARTGEPLYSPNHPENPQNPFAARDRELGIQTYLGLPIKRGDHVLGVLTFNTTGPREYGPEELTYLTSFADQAAIAIENARLYQAAHAELAERTRAEAALAARTHQLETVRTISEEIARELDLTTLLALIDQRAGKLVEADCGAIHLWDEDSQTLVTRAWHGYGPWRGQVHLRLGEGVMGTVAERREGMIVNDYRTSPYAHPLFLEKSETTSILCEPLLYRDRLLGVILVTNDERHHQFTEEDRHLFRLFATQAAIAIENARLYAELNQSFKSLQRAQEEMVRSEKLRALGQMAAGIAHDLNNMLAAILGQVELLRLRVADPVVQAGLATLETAATDGAHVVRRLQDFARQRTRSSLKPLDLRPVVAEALAITRPRWEDEAQRRGLTITVQTQLDDCPPVLGQAAEIREVLTNVILNAVDAMPSGGMLRLTTKQVRWSEGPEAGQLRGGEGGTPQRPNPLAPSQFVELSVADTGIGMTEEVRQRLFEPFFTTKGGQGTGLGLSVAYGIMERHGGRIDVASAPGQGTTVSLRFAVASEMAAASMTLPGVSAAPQRVLLIDDDPMVRLTLASILQVAGHSVQEADGGAAGLDLFAKVPVDLVLTDLGMPEVTGWDVARAVKARAPRLPIILLTGWGEQAAVEAGAEGLIERVLAKPVRMEDLLRAIAELTSVK